MSSGNSSLSNDTLGEACYSPTKYDAPDESDYSSVNDESDFPKVNDESDFLLVDDNERDSSWNALFLDSDHSVCLMMTTL